MKTNERDRILKISALGAFFIFGSMQKNEDL
jgi:hypothetical protein